MHNNTISEIEYYCQLNSCNVLAKEQLYQFVDEEQRMGAFKRLVPDPSLSISDFQKATIADITLLNFVKWRALNGDVNY